ncbi:RDD family protein [Vitiosangium sp. GDMCC 1.1324]|uniref:RDD family protein n=1 Tax=Vitiosangium sp. (strain GDMCC 1.1324) TaxID=2138576 RepID=UPI001E50F16D|nr:RDD family protein [Vitiosangium sp. GDMCC 1.1324]
MYQPDPSVTQRPGASCAEHADRPAVTICARCGSYACDLCLRVGQDRQDYCARCVPMLQQLAEPGARFVAVLVDRLAVFLPFLVTSILGGVLSRGDEAAIVGVLSILGMLGSLGVLGYQLHLISTTGQSIGKRMMGILVVRTDGKPIDLGRLVLLRNLVPEFINMATCGLFGIVDPLLIFTSERRCLHDHIADTKVVKVNTDR